MVVLQFVMVVLQFVQKPQALPFRGQVYRPRNLLFLNSGTADSSRDCAGLRNDKSLELLLHQYLETGHFTNFSSRIGRLIPEFGMIPLLILTSGG
jgi:hypothetical protein